MVKKGGSTVSDGFKKIIFFNRRNNQCGVHQYGVDTFDSIVKSSKYNFTYKAIDNYNDIESEFGKFDAYIYNYHPGTMDFLDVHQTRSDLVNVAIMHELYEEDYDNVSMDFFDFYIMGDPTLQTVRADLFGVPRNIVPAQLEAPHNLVPTIGTYGYANKHKRYDLIIKEVEREFNEAIIRINCPKGDFVFRDLSELESSLASSITKPGIKLHFTSNYMTKDETIKFLAQNDINLFFIETTRGVASSLDYALAAQRPIAITNSAMFRHLLAYNLPVTIEDNSLRLIIENGIKIFDRIYQDWSEESFIKRYNEIFDMIFSNAYTNSELISISNVGIKYNTILDDTARDFYEDTIGLLGETCPELITRKIPRANVQQAFTLDVIRSLIDPAKEDVNILCVGSYEDTAFETLQVIKTPNVNLFGIDTCINFDLETFYNLETTQKNFYDIIFSTSVLEHVAEDEPFIRQVYDLLKPGGIGIITVDFNDNYEPGFPKPHEDYRLYTKQDFIRLRSCLGPHNLIDQEDWDRDEYDFWYFGFNYAFATFTFQKLSS